MRSVSVVIPVKDGERFLEELLASVLSQGPDEVLVIDSGSRDGSLEIARGAGVQALEIAPEEFGHGRTRNLGAEATGGELICFLTQDAVPTAGWLGALRDAFTLDERVGAAYGPHLPRPDTSPMIARELTEFFAGMAPDGRPRAQGRSDLAFLSNVNACYARRCWEEIRFADVGYAEDQAFGRAMLEAGWLKVFHPDAGVVHAHDYGASEFARRYFDEYRGLRAQTGHVAPARPLAGVREVAASVSADSRWMRDRGWPARSRARWTGRSTLHHAGRGLFSALGSRAERLPAALERRISLEGTTSDAGPRAPGLAPAHPPRYPYVLPVSRDGPTPLGDPVARMSDRERLHVAVAVPPFRRGSGGHSTIFRLVCRLEDMGHTCTIWIHDPVHGDDRAEATVRRREIVEWFAPVRAPVFVGFGDWHGADVAVATGWETAHPIAAMPGCRARAYLVNDHEPEFFPTSAEALFAERTYSLGFFPISASTWLRDLLAERYGCEGAAFRLGVDHDVYRELSVARRPDTVVFYSRHMTPRRAVPLGVLALEELCSRRADLRVVTFGDPQPVPATFAQEHLGIATPERLARAYCEGAVGLCLSLTNYSLIPQEMMACGMPCVDLAHGSSEAAFGREGPAALARPDPVALADAMEQLLADPREWRRRSDEGVAFVADASWDSAAHEVEAGLREALARREREATRAQP